MALTHGATGITYFAHQISPTFNEDALFDDVTMRDAVGAINAQVHSLAPVLNSPTISGQATVTSSDADVPIDIMQKKLGEDTYLFAVGMRDDGIFRSKRYAHRGGCRSPWRGPPDHGEPVLRRLFGVWRSLVRITAIPEPAALALLIAPTFLLLRRQRLRAPGA